MSERLPDDPSMGIFEKEIFIPFRDCDCTGHVSLSTWLAWLAELAGDQYEARHLGREQLLSQGQVFLVSRFSIRFYRHPVCYETLNAATWEKGTDLVYFRRNYDFTDRDGAVCAQASSLWLLCDPVRHRILRPAAMGHPVLDVDRPTACPFPDRIDPPQDAQPLGRRPVVYTDLDANHHIYCANYGRIFMDWLPDEYRRLPCTGFTLNYVKEATLGETLILSGFAQGSQYTITGTHENGAVCFTAAMSF